MRGHVVNDSGLCYTRDEGLIWTVAGCDCVVCGNRPGRRLQYISITFHVFAAVTSACSVQSRLMCVFAAVLYTNGLELVIYDTPCPPAAGSDRSVIRG